MTGHIFAQTINFKRWAGKLLKDIKIRKKTLLQISQKIAYSGK